MYAKGDPNSGIFITRARGGIRMEVVDGEQWIATEGGARLLFRPTERITYGVWPKETREGTDARHALR